MAVSVLHVNTKAESSNTGSTFAFNATTLPTVGNALILTIIGVNSSGYTLTSVTDNQTGNTYAIEKSITISSSCGAYIVRCKNIIGSTGTFTLTAHNGQAANNAIVCGGIEVHNLDTTAAVDASGTGTATTGNCTVATTGATTLADEICVWAYTNDGGNASQGIVVPAGTTSIVIEQDSSTFVSASGDYKILTVTGTQSGIYQPGAGVAHSAGCVATFKGLASADVLMSQIQL